MITPENATTGGPERNIGLGFVPDFVRGLAVMAFRGAVVVASFAVLKEAELLQYAHPATMGARGNPTRWEQ